MGTEKSLVCLISCENAPNTRVYSWHQFFGIAQWSIRKGILCWVPFIWWKRAITNNWIVLSFVSACEKCNGGIHNCTNRTISWTSQQNDNLRLSGKHVHMKNQEETEIREQEQTIFVTEVWQSKPSFFFGFLTSALKKCFALTGLVFPLASNLT